MIIVLTDVCDENAVYFQFSSTNCLRIQIINYIYIAHTTQQKICIGGLESVYKFVITITSFYWKNWRKLKSLNENTSALKTQEGGMRIKVGLRGVANQIYKNENKKVHFMSILKHLLWKV